MLPNKIPPILYSIKIDTRVPFWAEFWNLAHCPNQAQLEAQLLDVVTVDYDYGPDFW